MLIALQMFKSHTSSGVDKNYVNFPEEKPEKLINTYNGLELTPCRVGILEWILYRKWIELKFY